MVRKAIAITLAAMVTSCATTKPKAKNLAFDRYAQHDSSNSYFQGLLVVDPERQDTLIDFNSEKYFTPASNVKIFTLYGGLSMLPDKVPALNYLHRNDTLYIEGTGDPSWFHPYFQDSSALNFLQAYRNIVLHLGNYQGNKYLPGWAWEDYDARFSPEIGALPLYGNVVTITQSDSLAVRPVYFSTDTARGSADKLRSEGSNHFFVPYTTDTLQIPFITSHALTQKLLERKLQQAVSIVDSFPKGSKKTRPGISSDSILKRMMHTSDNFLAEQVMIMISSQISDTLGFSIAKSHLIKNQLKDLSHEPRWVDGSGLSRYNLFTPKSIVAVLYKLYKSIPQKRLFNLFPYWDESGTLDSGSKDSFIIAKSGSLSNNYNLSGYLVTKSGRVLIFSFMNNHYKEPSASIRGNIKAVLQRIHDAN